MGRMLALLRTLALLGPLQPGRAGLGRGPGQGELGEEQLRLVSNQLWSLRQRPGWGEGWGGRGWGQQKEGMG